MLKRISLHWYILIALFLGALFGFYFSSAVPWISWMGDLFLRLLKMVIVPMVFASLVTGVASLGNSDNLGRIGLKTMVFYIFTTLLAIITGLFFVNLIAPGKGAYLGLNAKPEGLTVTERPLSNILLEVVPENIFQALSQANMLQIIFFALLFGFFITRLPARQSDPIKRAFESIGELMMKMTMFIVQFTPLGVFGIVAKVTADVAGDTTALLNIGGHLGTYMVVVILGLTFHSLVSLSLILRIAVKLNPLTHIKNMSSVILTAFSTSSSNATLPLTMSEIENKSGVSASIAGFTLPLGATINMNGTALYECVAVMFISQAYGIELSIAQQAIVVLTALLAAVGSAGIPMAGLVMMAVVLSAVGLPLEGIGLILAVDRILDMFRTVVNVYGDTCAAVFVAHSEGEIINR